MVKLSALKSQNIITRVLDVNLVYILNYTKTIEIVVILWKASKTLVKS